MTRVFTTFVVPVLSVVLVLLLKLSSVPIIGYRSPSLLFLAAVIVSAWYGGLLAGLLATILAALAIAYSFVTPHNSFALQSDDFGLISLFCIEGLFVSVLGAARYHAISRLHQRERQQAAVAELSQQALTDTDIPALMEVAVTLVARILDVEFVKVLESLPDGESLRLRAGIGWKAGLVGQVTASTHSQASYTLRVREPVIVDDLPRETRFKSPLLEEHGVMSGISVIIHSARAPQGQEPFGVLGAHTTRSVRFTQDDIHFLQAVADVLAAAIERKRAEDALASSEANNRVFLAAIPDLMFRLDRQGTLLELLSQQSWDLALSSDQFSGRNITELLPDEITKPALECIERALQQDTVQVFEYGISIDQKPQYFEARIVASSDNEVLAIVRNISEQKEAEQERDQLLIKEREARQHAEDNANRIARLHTVSAALAEALTPAQVADVAVAEAMAALDAQAGNLTTLVNDSQTLEISSATGYSQQTIDNWRQFPLTSAAPAAEAVRTGTAVFITNTEELAARYPAIAAAKMTPYEALASIPMMVENRAIGSLNLSFAQARRFTASDEAFMQVVARQCARAFDHARLYEAERLARAEAEEAQRHLEFLAEASAQLSSSLDYRTTLSSVAQLAVPHIADWCTVHIVDEDGFPQQVAVAHVDPAKVAWAQEINQLYPPDMNAPNGLPAVLRTRRPEIYPEISDELLQAAALDEEHLKLMQEVGFHSVMIVPLLVRGQAVGALSFVATTESNRHYDSDDLALAEDLARRAATAVDNARLYQQAQEANRIKDDFLATLSHELRTPLNAILGWTHLLHSGQLDASTADHALGSIERSAKSQAQLINDLLDVSRIISGKLSLEHASVELKPLVQAAVETMLPVAEAKSIQLKTNIDIESDVVTGDATRLQQIVWNLISNAIKFTPDGGDVEVRLEQADDTARIIVRDTGAGINPDFLPHVFDRFRQADSTTTRRHGGLGLGLSIVRHLVDMHGGTITADSPGEGQGSTFTVELPLAIVADSLIQAALEGTSPVTDEQKKSTGQAPILAGLKILLVDDESDTREMLTALLQQHGAEIRSAESATAALATIEEWTPDAMISDIGMPDMDGYMLLARVRSEDTQHEKPIPAVAVTAYASEDDRVRAMSAGFQMYLTKPIQPEELANAVARLAQTAALNTQ